MSALNAIILLLGFFPSMIPNTPVVAITEKGIPIAVNCA